MKTLSWNRKTTLVVASLLAVAHAAHADEPHIAATFSICAADPENGLCGAAVASKYPAVGRVVPYARAGVGAFCTQHWLVAKWGEPALDLLAAGKRPDEVLGHFLAEDKQPGLRQLACVDMQGRVAVHNPIAAPKGSEYWGAICGKYYSAQGNTLTDRDVVTEMGRAYEETKGSFADRLMAALVAADVAGGDHRGRLAAGIRVCKKNVEGYWLELYVDDSGDAVLDLAERYAELKHDAKGDWPGGQLPFQRPAKSVPPKSPPAKPSP
jgi:uncharacterized Ntn-hydrolase superfamily protein